MKQKKLIDRIITKKRERYRQTETQTHRERDRLIE